MRFYHSLHIFFFLLPLGASAQVDTSVSQYGQYFFDQDEIVFEFDRRAYEAAGRDTKSAADFADLGILEAIATGKVQQWSKDNWVLRQLDEYRFQLRKKRADFKDAPNWLFKLLIKSDYWSIPDSIFEKQGWLGRYEIKNPDLLPPPGDTGQVVFHLDGFQHSQVVILTGSFNNWDEQAYKMKRDANGWTLHLSLSPQEYEYKFIVDGKWIHDPANPEKRVNQYGTLNSVLRLTKMVQFNLEGFVDAKKVILAGSFNAWNEKAIPLHRTESGWWTELPLSSGKHTYKYIVDGHWMTDPANPRTEHDLHGNENSVLFVR